MNIPITKPLLGEEEVEAVSKVIRSGWLAQGKKVAAFENMVAETVGAKEVVAVSSCTTALHIALRTTGLQCGDWACLTKPCLERCEIICPSYTFVATINALLYMGIKPVLVDIEAQSGNIDPDLIEAAITPRTRAIMPVHQLGYPADLDRIQKIASNYDLLVIEDAAQACGGEYKGQKVIIYIKDQWGDKVYKYHICDHLFNTIVLQIYYNIITMKITIPCFCKFCMVLRTNNV